MIQEESTQSGFRSTITGTVVLCALFTVLGLCVTFFCPEKSDSLASIEGEIITDDVPQNVALEIAYTADFITAGESQNFFPDGIDRLYIREFLNLAKESSDDKGLEYYRNPQTRGAVEWFYINLTGRREVALAILAAADRENIPLTLAFALAHTESRFNFHAVNHNVNGSIDRGLFQLNDRSFPQLEDTDFFSPQVSARYGMKHLRFCMGVAKDDLVAVAMYNAGVTRVKNNQTPKSTLAYVSNISRYRAILDTEFYRDVVSVYEEENSILEKEEF